MIIAIDTDEKTVEIQTKSFTLKELIDVLKMFNIDVDVYRINIPQPNLTNLSGLWTSDSHIKPIDNSWDIVRDSTVFKPNSYPHLNTSSGLYMDPILNNSSIVP